jgi:simple sugar transport system substrate-binding protein
MPTNEKVGRKQVGLKTIVGSVAKWSAGVGLALSLAVSPALAGGKNYYWISHGSAADPVWTYFLAGAEQWAKDTGNKVNTSFHNGDVASQQEAIRAAVAAGADGIVTASPAAGSLVQPVDEAIAKNIPVIGFNSDDKGVHFAAFVGGDNFKAGADHARYLVDKGLVKSGDFVWMPVEVPGATYGADQERGIATIFKPLNITWEITDSTLDQADIISRMSDYLTANRKKITAILPLGDLVSGSIKRVFDQVGVKAGEIPVVGWGNSLDTANEVLDGYVMAAAWQDPQAQSYLALSLAAMQGGGIKPGFNITTGSMYEKDKAADFVALMGGKK